MKTDTIYKFDIGDKVTDGIVEGEVLQIHPKYAIVVSEGVEHRIWVENLTISSYQPKRTQIYKESFIYKGYRTKHFNRQLSESFKNITNECADEYAVLSCLKALDYVLGVEDSTIVESYSTVRIQVERLRRYAKKVGCPYLVEQVASTVEEELMKFAVLENKNFTTTDRIMVARVIAQTAGIINISNADPTTTINQAAIKLKTSQLTPQGWALLGRLLNVATRAGIRWQKDTFSPSIQQEMGLL